MLLAHHLEVHLRLFSCCRTFSFGPFCPWHIRGLNQLWRFFIFFNIFAMTSSRKFTWNLQIPWVFQVFHGCPEIPWVFQVFHVGRHHEIKNFAFLKGGGGPTFKNLISISISKIMKIFCFKFHQNRPINKEFDILEG